MTTAGRSERAPRAFLCGRDHPGKALPELCTGGPILLFGMTLLSSLLLSDSANALVCDVIIGPNQAHS